MVINKQSLKIMWTVRTDRADLLLAKMGTSYAEVSASCNCCQCRKSQHKEVSISSSPTSLGYDIQRRTGSPRSLLASNISI